MKKKETLIVIDGNALLHRAFHALPDTLRTKDGQLTNAAYGFMLVFLNVLKEFEPEYVAAAFDRKGKTFRHQAFADYKGKRKKAPDELYEQIPLVKKVLKAFEVPVFALKGIEADDVVGAIAQKVKMIKGLETIIVTGDLDTLQLVDDKTKVFTLRRGTKDTVLYDAEEVKKKLGVLPDQVVDFKALAGDSSDNIPGVAGVGQKTAADLLNKYQSLKEIYAHLDEIKAAKKALAEKLEKSKEDAFLSQRLAKIQKDMDLDFYLDKAQFGAYDKQSVAEVFKELEFNTLLKKLDLGAAAEAGGAGGKNRGDSNNQNSAQSAAGANSKNQELVIKLKEITDLKNFEKELTQLFSKNENVFIGVWERPEIKLKEVSVFDCKLKYLGLMGETQAECLMLDLPGLAGSESRKLKLAPNLALQALGKILIKFPKTRPVFLGAKPEWQLLKNHGLFLEESFEDAQLLAYLVNAGRSGVEFLDLVKSHQLSLRYLEKMQEKKKGQTRLLLSAEETKEDKGLAKFYLAERIGVMRRIYPELKKGMEYIARLQDKQGICPKPAGEGGNYDLEYVYEQIEKPLLKVLAEMELRGILIDQKKLAELKKEYQKEGDSLRDQVMQRAGREFNLDSSQQLSKVFYEDLGFSTEGIKKGKSGFYSTSAEALELLSGEYEVAKLVLRYRELTKLINTYIDPLPKLVREGTGRLHTQFNQMITTTGRLSSSNPNLQNIPTRTPEGQRIREAFVAGSGSLLVSADYSQIELRLAAHYSGDETMLKVFKENGDIHTETAARVNGLKVAEVDKEVRRTAKALNFGLIYGMGAYGFARSAGIPVNQARDFIEKYKAQFPQMFEYLKQARDTAKEKGYVETMFGRRRYVPEIKSRNWQQKASGERMAVNMPLQGSAADILKLAMVAVARYLGKKKLGDSVKMLLSVHDEILFEIKKAKIKTVVPEIKKIMEETTQLSVPLQVDVKKGQNWGEMK